MKNQKGITLIALVITIIVLLILAGVTIAMLTGENGLITKSSDAATATKIAQAKEAATTEVAAQYASYLETKYNGTTVGTGSFPTAQITEKITADSYEIDGATITLKGVTTKAGETITGTIDDKAKITWDDEN